MAEDTTLGEGSVGLANDIELHAERIRRERTKRRQQQLNAPVTAEMPLVGNLIGEDHVNYVLMYNMLTGIRIGVCLTFDYGQLGLIYNRYQGVRQKSRNLLQTKISQLVINSLLICLSIPLSHSPLPFLISLQYRQ